MANDATAIPPEVKIESPEVKIENESNLVAQFQGWLSRWLPDKGVSYHSEMSNERPVLDTGYSPVYDHPRDGEFNTRAARMPIFTSFAPEAYFPVMRDTFLYDSELIEMAADTPFGIASHVPWHERVNIARPPAIASGSQVVLQPHDTELLLAPLAGR